MARRTAVSVIDADGRDKGKRFLITEMSASQAERWAVRAFLAMGATGIEIPDDIKEAGLAGLAALGVQAMGFIPFEAAEPLLAEMFDCIQFVPDPANPTFTRPLIEDDIEEVATRLKLRKDVIELHTGFSLAARASQKEDTTSRAA